MRIECPDCGAAYEVREELLPPGRAVRCACCGQSWVPAPADAAPARLPDEAPGEAATLRRPLPLRIRPRLGAPLAAPDPPASAPPPPEAPAGPSSGLAAPLLAWAASLLAVAGALLALWLWRGDVAALWPPAGRLVQALGG